MPLGPALTINDSTCFLGARIAVCHAAQNPLYGAQRMVANIVDSPGRVGAVNGLAVASRATTSARRMAISLDRPNIRPVRPVRTRPSAPRIRSRTGETAQRGRQHGTRWAMVQCGISVWIDQCRQFACICAAQARTLRVAPARLGAGPPGGRCRSPRSESGCPKPSRAAADPIDSKNDSGVVMASSDSAGLRTVRSLKLAASLADMPQGAVALRAKHAVGATPTPPSAPSAWSGRGHCSSRWRFPAPCRNYR